MAATKGMLRGETLTESESKYAEHEIKGIKHGPNYAPRRDKASGSVRSAVGGTAIAVGTIVIIYGVLAGGAAGVACSVFGGTAALLGLTVVLSSRNVA